MSETPATRFLRQHKIAFIGHVYDYVAHGGTAASAQGLAVDEHLVVKTLVFEDEHAKPLIVLMHGDRKVSARELARQIGVKSVAPCAPETAQRHSGYRVGGTSPFGTKKALPVFVQQSILDLPKIYINGGRRGFLVEIDPRHLLPLLNPVLVNVALEK
ncbi:MAG: aminoacyl-tRNA deacylase [Zoogloeaceae bacterium]|jgi:Cys-tRNA(Pro) deacylase|nr:aminoacyl-tRNA deacylase [Zoogloeaceae bacterium]